MFVTHSVFSSNFINSLFYPAKKTVGFILFGKERLRNYASRPSHPGNLSGIVRSKNASSPVTMRLCHTLTVLSLTFTIGFFYFSPIKVKGKSVSQWHTIYQNTDGYWLWSTIQKSLPCHNLWQSVQPFLQNGIFLCRFQRSTFPNVMAIFGMLFSTWYVVLCCPMLLSTWLGCR